MPVDGSVLARCQFGQHGRGQHLRQLPRLAAARRVPQVERHPARALCLEGVQLGRLNYSCLGMLRGEVTVRLPDNYDWAQFGATGSIIPMNDVINRINKIALPRRPLTSIVLGSLEGGLTYSNIARETTLRFEVRSESAEILDQTGRQIGDIAQEVAAQSGVGVDIDLFARRQPGAR